MAETGMRVPFRTQAPLTLPGTLSTAEQRDQSRFAMANSSTKHTVLAQKGKGRQRPTLPHTFACSTILRGLTWGFQQA
jgi:hypothetical protein